jgi:hypothetical protein
MEEVTRSVPEIMLDSIYVAMSDARSSGAENIMQLRICLNYLEKEHGYRPPAICGFMEELEKE